MTFQLHSRRIFHPAFAAVLLSAATAMVVAQPASMHKVGQAPRPAVNPPRPAHEPKQNGPKGNQEHLPQWMARHSNLSPADQQRALENEPGFRDLPLQTEQRMHDRITQLNNMTPEQRRRLLERNEQIEHLTPTQRQQWHGAMEQYRGLPEDRRRMVARALRDLREMPQPQRQAILNSDSFRGQFSDQEATPSPISSRSNPTSRFSIRTTALRSESEKQFAPKRCSRRRRGAIFCCGEGIGLRGIWQRFATKWAIWKLCG